MHGELDTAHGVKQDRVPADCMFNVPNRHLQVFTMNSLRIP